MAEFSAYSRIRVRMLDIWKRLHASLRQRKNRAIERLEAMPPAHLDKLVKRVIIGVTIAGGVTALALFGSTSAPRPGPQATEDAEQAGQQADVAARQAEQAADAASKTQQVADAQQQLEQDDREAAEQADQQAAVANAPTVLTADDCKGPSLRSGLMSLIDNGLAKSTGGFSKVEDLSVYHVSGEVEDDKIVCTASMTLNIKTVYGMRVETYSGADVEMKPQRGGNYYVRILSIGTLANAQDVIGSN